MFLSALTRTVSRCALAGSRYASTQAGKTSLFPKFLPSSFSPASKSNLVLRTIQPQLQRQAPLRAGGGFWGLIAGTALSGASYSIYAAYKDYKRKVEEKRRIIEAYEREKLLSKYNSAKYQLYPHVQQTLQLLKLPAEEHPLSIEEINDLKRQLQNACTKIERDDLIAQYNHFTDPLSRAICDLVKKDEFQFTAKQIKTMGRTIQQVQTLEKKREALLQYKDKHPEIQKWETRPDYMSKPLSVIEAELRASAEAIKKREREDFLRRGPGLC